MPITLHDDLSRISVTLIATVVTVCLKTNVYLDVGLCFLTKLTRFL